MSGENSILVVCDCGKKLKAPATSMGKKARCPACGNVLVLTPANPAPTPVTVPTEDEGLSAMYDLAEQEKLAAPAADVPRCPQCGSTFEEGVVLCTNCGYDTRTGKSLATAAPANPKKLNYPSSAPGKKGKAADMMSPQGSFVAGIALSAAFALAASVVWFLVAWAIGLSIGYIAILIGFAAGVGMQIGQKGYSTAGGYTAAGLTLCAIMLAKLAVIEFVLLPIASHHNPNASIFNLNQAALAYYFFKPIGLIIIAVGMGAAYRTANGSVSG